MIYRIPENWDYNESMEMLYLFYQKADELLSETSPDTYSLPLHNSMTLLKEVEETFDLLNEYGMLTEYGDYVISTAAVVFEAKNDNRIHAEMRKENNPLSLDNYVAYLFGPDGNLINYQFEY